jgi:hypothetical protein
MRTPVGPLAGNRLLKEEPCGVASVLTEAKEGLHFARGATLGEYETGKEEEIDSTFHPFRDLPEGRPQFVEILGGDH